MKSQGSVASSITTDDLAKMSRATVFSGHQSVRINVLDSSRANGIYQGQRYYWLHKGYASDSEYLNGEDARVAATAWLLAIAQASPR